MEATVRGGCLASLSRGSRPLARVATVLLRKPSQPLRFTFRDNRRHGSVHHAARNTNGGIIPPPTVSLVPAFTIKAARLASYRAAVNLLTAVVVVAVLFYLS